MAIVCVCLHFLPANNAAFPVCCDSPSLSSVDGLFYDKPTMRDPGRIRVITGASAYVLANAPRAHSRGSARIPKTEINLSQKPCRAPTLAKTASRTLAHARAECKAKCYFSITILSQFSILNSFGFFIFLGGYAVVLLILFPRHVRPSTQYMLSSGKSSKMLNVFFSMSMFLW